MRRRKFITLLGIAAAAWPLAARAQQSAMPVIGYLGSESPALYADRLNAFRQGLRETGYVEGRNVIIDYRWLAQDQGFATLASDLVRRQVKVIASFGGPAAALAVKAATTTIPAVFRVAGDPLALGLVASLSRPGGNLTGVTTLGIEVGPKRLELLHELVPGATSFAVLTNPNGRLAGSLSSDLQLAARTLMMQLHVLHASSEREFRSAFANFIQLRAGGLVISVDPFFVSQIEHLAALTVQHKVPAIFQYREFVAAGGLMSYGGNIAEANRQVGVYAGRILRGDKASDLPVQQVTKVELIINMKTAKALGINFPLTLLGRADEVIE